MSSISSVSTSASVWQPSRPDVGKMSDKLFSRLDQDGGGTIDEAELSAAAKQAGAPESDVAVLMKGFDSDGDKAISKQELTAGMQALSDQFEANFNASRTQTAATAQGPSAAESADANTLAGSLHAIAGAGAAPAPVDGGGQPVDTTVAVGKGNAGAAPAAQTTYDKADANEDGTVTQLERLAYQAKQAEKAQQTSGKSTEAGGAADRIALAYASASDTVSAGSTVSEQA